ncbi:MAG TPA: hypothetical protein VE291_05415 [Terracidiphilus sp.]|jgi:hypothetical protein|nr:hypothetical protein [Terracidiphilus sp.]
MRATRIAILLLAGCAGLAAQSPQTTQPLGTETHAGEPRSSETHTSALGFSYSVPADWEVVDAAATLPEVKQKAEQNAATDADKKGAACVNVALTARHGDPVSVIVVVELPFGCLGQAATDKDLPGFAQGVSEGLKQSFDLTEPMTGSYKLGTHGMWIERSKGTPKGHAEMHYTVEIACSLLKKGAACWMMMAADDAALKVFENGEVSLEGAAPMALAPGTAFDKKPGL